MGCRPREEVAPQTTQDRGSWQGCGAGPGALPGTGLRSKREREETSLPTPFWGPNPRRSPCHALLGWISSLHTRTPEELGMGSTAGPPARVQIFKLSPLMDTFILKSKSSCKILPLSHQEGKISELTEQAGMRFEPPVSWAPAPLPPPRAGRLPGAAGHWDPRVVPRLTSPPPQPRARSPFV